MKEMKRKIMAISLAITLIAVLAAPLAAYAADGTTQISGNVVSSYSFNAPSTISLGSMALGTTVTGSSSTPGTLTGTDPLGYTVTAIDAKTPNTGYMISGSNVLQNKFQIGNSLATVANSDTARTLLDVSTAPSSVSVPLYVSQQIAANDLVASGYTITITFTVTAK